MVLPAESSSPESEHAVETDDLVDTDVPAFQVAQPKKQHSLSPLGHISTVDAPQEVEAVSFRCPC